MNKQTTKRSLRVLYIVTALFAVVMTLQLFSAHVSLSAETDGIIFSINK